MKRPHWIGIGLMGLMVAGLLGCQQRPAVPTPLVEPTEPAVVLVVTATSQPTLAPTATSLVQPTITPLRVFSNTATATVAATVAGATTTVATRAAVATRTSAPTRAATAASAPPEIPTVVLPPTTEANATSAPPTVAPPTAGPVSIPAPAPIAPEGLNFREGDSLKLQFASVGPLAGDQCYKVDLFLDNVGNGSAGDDWVGLCGDQSAAGTRLTFTILPPRFHNDPNYGTVLGVAEGYGPAERLNMRWTVTVVQNNGLSSDGVHYNVVPLSPPSAALNNTFIR